MRGYKSTYWEPRDKQSFRCVDCGRSREEASQIDVHHIDENHLNNDDDNLTGLCRRCHLQGRHERTHDLPTAFDPPSANSASPPSGGSFGP